MIKTPAKRGVDISLKFWQNFFFTRGIVPRFDPLMEGGMHRRIRRRGGQKWAGEVVIAYEY